MPNKHISSKVEDGICDMIIDFSNSRNIKKLTWALIEKHSGFSRQALNANAHIKGAYQTAKGKQKSTIKSKDDIIEDKNKSIESLNAKLEKQLKMLTNYDEKFIRWMSNASEYLTENELNRPVSHSLKTEQRLRGVK
jgi:hypothetical protein